MKTCGECKYFKKDFDRDKFLQEAENDDERSLYKSLWQDNSGYCSKQSTKNWIAFPTADFDAGEHFEDKK